MNENDRFVDSNLPSTLLFYFRTMRRIVLLLSFLISVGSLFGQKQAEKDSVRNIIALGGQFGMQIPAGDLSERFGFGGIAGGNLMYKTKTNWTMSLNYSVVYGNRVKGDSLFSNLQTTNGDIIGRDGSPVQVLVQERGHLIDFRIGKIFPVLGPNDNSGIHAQLGIGAMQHKIKVLENSESVPQLMGDYLKGYDRLVNGISLVQTIGYQNFSSYNLLNYYIGLEFYEGFTQGRRTLYYPTGMPDLDKRFDMVISLVAKWYFPFNKRQPRDFYYY